jgi:methyl-accepting chemotaxis protein
MRNLLKRLTDNFADKTSLLSLVTAVLLIVLYAQTGHPLLLVAFLPYTILAAVGIFSHQQSLDMVEKLKGIEDMPTTSPVPRASMDTITTRMGVTVDGLVRATHAINDVTLQQASSAQEQAEVIGTTNNMLDGFLALSEKISEQARSISQTAQQAATYSENGQHALQDTLSSMNDIRHQVEAIGETIVTLARLTRRIDDIIRSVSEIATQSNLLALNASIEAARAGSHGRGFAVVADEVRALAQQSTESAAAVRSILGEIQKAMKDTVQATQAGMENVETGVAKTREANTVIIQLADTVRQSREAVSSIYEVIRQQANGMEEIAISMDKIQFITRQTLASTRTVESVSANLTRLASDLQTVVSPDAEITNHPLN